MRKIGQNLLKQRKRERKKERKKEKKTCISFSRTGVVYWALLDLSQIGWHLRHCKVTNR